MPTNTSATKRTLTGESSSVTPAKSAKRKKTASRAGSVQPEHRLADNGDVVFAVGGGRDVTHLLVSSVLLSTASKYFATLFSSRFLEGQHLSTDNPPTIEFPDDDAGIFEWLLSILHFRDINTFDTDKSSHTSAHSVDDLVVVLTMADKYGCTRAVRSQLAIAARDAASEYEWEREDHAPDYSQANLFRLLLDSITIAYVVEDMEAFWVAGRRLLLHTGLTESFTQASTRPSAHMLPSALWSMCQMTSYTWSRLTSYTAYLSEQRGNARAYAVARLREVTQVHGSIAVTVYESLARAVQRPDHEDNLERLLTICDTDGISLCRIVTHMTEDFQDRMYEYNEMEPTKSARGIAHECMAKCNHVLEHMRGPCLKCAKLGVFKSDSWKNNPACDHASFLNFGPKPCLSSACDEHADD